MHCLSWQDAEKETPKTRQWTTTDFAHGATWRSSGDRPWSVSVFAAIMCEYDVIHKTGST